MRSLFLPMASFATVFCLVLLGLVVGQNSQGLTIDPTLDVCKPPILAPIQSIPKLPVNERTHTISQPQPLSATGGLGDQLALAGPAFHFERQCGPNGCQLVKVPNPASQQAQQQQQPADTETRRARKPVRTATKAVVSRVRVFQRIRARRG